LVLKLVTLNSFMTDECYLGGNRSLYMAFTIWPKIGLGHEM